MCADAPNPLDYGPDDLSPAATWTTWLVVIIVWTVGLVSWALWTSAFIYGFFRLFG
jgi:hypothetical protein